MKFTSILLATVGAVIVQVALARYTVGGRWVFDFVLVAVAVSGMQGGAVAGTLAGTMGGLLLDLLSGGIVGVGGLAKTLTGFVLGVVGTNFVLVRPYARAAIVAAATVVHRLIIVVLNALIDQRWSGVSGRTLAAEVAINAVAALIVFHLANALPNAVARQRVHRRSSLSRRQW